MENKQNKIIKNEKFQKYLDKYSEDYGKNQDENVEFVEYPQEYFLIDAFLNKPNTDFDENEYERNINNIESEGYWFFARASSPICDKPNITFVKYLNVLTEENIENYFNDLYPIVSEIERKEKGIYSEKLEEYINLFEEDDEDEDISNSKKENSAVINFFLLYENKEITKEKVEKIFNKNVKEVIKADLGVKQLPFKLKVDLFSLDDVNNILNDNLGFSEIATDFGEIKVDNCNNILKTANTLELVEDAFICNVSSQSLNELWKKHRNKLLGMNVRYHVKNKLDQEVKETIQESPNEFWFLNNGLTIITSKADFDRENNLLKLTNFSIINGGQTTWNIGNSEIKNDFFLSCKVLVINNKNVDAREKTNELIDKICKATNSQKPIKNKDLLANNKYLRGIKQKFEASRDELKIYFEFKRGQWDSLESRDKSKYKELGKQAKMDVDFLLQANDCFTEFHSGAKNNKQKILRKVLSKSGEQILINLNTEEKCRFYKQAWMFTEIITKFAKKGKNKKNITIREKEILNFLIYCKFYFILILKFLVFLKMNKDNFSENIVKIADYSYKDDDSKEEILKEINDTWEKSQITEFRPNINKEETREIIRKSLEKIFASNISRFYDLLQTWTNKGKESISNMSKLDNNFWPFIQELFLLFKEEDEDNEKTEKLFYLFLKLYGLDN